MTSVDDNLDEFGQRTLAALQPVPNLDSQTASELKVQFLLQAEQLQQDSRLVVSGVSRSQSQADRRVLWAAWHKPAFKALTAVFLTLIVILIGGSFTVSAAQSSLPGQTLYPIKSWSEDIQLSLASSPQEKLNLTLSYTNRRMDEISSLMSKGKLLDDHTSDRFQQELERALQIAAQMNDTELQNALMEIKAHAQSQGMTIQELINTLPPQSDQAVHRLQARLNEQVQISSAGETDPNGFRQHVRDRQNKHQESNQTSKTLEPQATSGGLINTPTPEVSSTSNGPGNDLIQSTEKPGGGGPGNGQNQSPPGNGNHGPNPTHTPKP